MTYLKALNATLMLSCTFIAAQVVHADTMYGIYADVAYWSYSGDLAFSQTNTNDESFSFDSEFTPMVSLAVEHGIPMLPNFKVRYAKLQAKENKNVGNFIFDNQSFSGNTTLDMHMTHTDVLAYYEVLDNIVSLDVGLGAKIVDGDLTVKNSSLSELEDVSVPVPMIYAAVKGELPLTGLSASADMAGFEYDDNRVVDASARVQYNFVDSALFDFGGFAGYRMLDIQINDISGTDASGTFKGPFAGLVAHF